MKVVIDSPAYTRNIVTNCVQVSMKPVAVCSQLTGIARNKNPEKNKTKPDMINTNVILKSPASVTADVMDKPGAPDDTKQIEV